MVVMSYLFGSTRKVETIIIIEIFRKKSLNLVFLAFLTCTGQKHPPRGVLSKSFAENMQQIYRRTSVPKCDFNKVAKQLY